MIFIGPLPPPVHGMAAMNKAVCDRLLSDGVEVKQIDTAPKTLSRHLSARLSRVPAVISGWFQLIKWCRTGQTEIVYITLSGGWGQIYDLLMTITSRILGTHIVFHHHTYAFLLNWKWLAALIFRVAGNKTTHVVLCSKMAKDLFDKYGVENSIVLSNIVTMPLQKGKERQKISKLGFIGNITEEKGGDIILALAKEIRKTNLPLLMVVGGPCPEAKLKKLFQQADKDNLINWLGPIYNKQKEAFFSSIDALIMPSKYEAEPLVVWEALGSGAPVIAYSRGCIPSQIKNGAGVIIHQDRSFVGETLPVLERWLADPGQYIDASKAALRVYHDATAKRESSWLKLLTHTSKRRQRMNLEL